MIRDKIIVYEDLEELYLKCYSCNEKHSFHKCPAIQFVSDKQRTILIHQKRIKNRKSLRRSLPKPRRIKKFHALIDSNIIQTNSEKFHALIDINGSEKSFDENKPTLIVKVPEPKYAVASAIKFRSIESKYENEDGRNNSASSLSPLLKSPSLHSRPLVSIRKKSVMQSNFNPEEKKRSMGREPRVTIYDDAFFFSLTFVFLFKNKGEHHRAN
jgi:hypothetical protein